MNTLEKLLREAVDGLRHDEKARFTLAVGDCVELLHEIDQLRGRVDEQRELLRKITEEHAGERVYILALQGELFEHLSLIVGYLEEETSQGDGIAEEHFDGYTAAKALLKRASERSAQWENALFSLEDLRSETREACARICDERAKKADHARNYLDDVGPEDHLRLSASADEAEACAAAIRAGERASQNRPSAEVEASERCVHCGVELEVEGDSGHCLSCTSGGQQP